MPSQARGEVSATSTKRGVLPLGEGTTVVDGKGPASAPTRPARVGTSPTPHVEVHIDAATERLDLEDRFIDEGEIGRGGMAFVHRVHERTLSRTVALKALPNEVSHDVDVRNRFLMEAQVTGQLEHPNIVPVYELGSDDAGTFFFTMRLISGRSLTEVIRDAPDRHDPTWLEETIDVFLRVCDALAFAHSRGVIHRDIKPSNIMVGDHGQVYLVDWGIAKVIGEIEPPSSRAAIERLRTTVQPEEEQGQVMGTFAYMSPEQAWGDVDAIDQRTDVFGLGAVLYRILTGRPPYVAKKVSEVHQMARFGRVPDPTAELHSPLAKALAVIALRALRVEQDMRFATVAEMRAAVQRTLRGGGRFETTRFPAGTLVIREGTRGDAAYVVRRGRCSVFKQTERGTIRLHELAEGDVFGEAAVFTGEPRNASVEALTDVELLVVPGATLVETLGLDTWSGAFVRVLGERLTEGNRRVQELERTTAAQQLALRAVSVVARAPGLCLPLAAVAAQLGTDVRAVADASALVAELALEQRSGASVLAIASPQTG